MKHKIVEEVATEVISNEDGTYTVTEKNLDELVAFLKKKLQDKKYRNLPNPKSPLMLEVTSFAVQSVAQIIYVTQGLIEANEIQADKYGFLTGNVTTFDKWNKIINTTWLEAGRDFLAKQQAKAAKEQAEQAAKDGVKLEVEEPSLLSATDVAAVAAEPTCEADSKVEVKTSKGQRWILDKVNYTLTYKCKGEDKTIKIAPKGSWRSTILKYFVKTLQWIKKVYNEFVDRCIGIKQAIQFKWMFMKMERERKAQEKANAKAAEAKSNKKEDKASDTGMDFLESLPDAV